TPPPQTQPLLNPVSSSSSSPYPLYQDSITARSSSLSFSPAYPAQQQQQHHFNPLAAPFPSRTSRPSAPSVAVGHSTYSPLATNEFELEPPQRTFGATLERPDRPYSVASFSNISTHSNEPLNQAYTTPTPPHSAAARTAGTRATSAARTKKKPSTRVKITRTMAPKSGPSNPLDLPEHRDRGSEAGLEEIDLDDRNVSKPAVGIKKKRRNIFMRIIRRRRNPNTFKIIGTGRKARFSNELGALLLSIATLIYSTTLYHKRHLYMVAKRSDVNYYARTAPSLLCIGLVILYGANFVVTLTYGDQVKSPNPYAGSGFDKAGSFF
ncbi:hypothetical protein BGW38_006747, partial [Lunasporangiospora selenospora]